MSKEIRTLFYSINRMDSPPPPGKRPQESDLSIDIRTVHGHMSWVQ